MDGPAVCLHFNFDIFIIYTFLSLLKSSQFLANPYFSSTALLFYFLQSLSSPLSPCKRHHVPPPRITLQDLVPEQILDKDPPTPPVSDTEAPSPGPMSCASPREKGEFLCALVVVLNSFAQALHMFFRVLFDYVCFFQTAPSNRQKLSPFKVLQRRCTCSRVSASWHHQ